MAISKKQIIYKLLWSIFDCAPKHNRLPYMITNITSMNLDTAYNADKSFIMITHKRKHLVLRDDANLLIGIIINVTNEKLTLISHIPEPVQDIKKEIFLEESKIEGCKIYETNDGTTIGLYYYKDEWVIRTNNGYDVGNYKWVGNKTYKTVFEEITAVYPEFSLDKLDKNKCYTIGFKHPDFHPFREGLAIGVIKAWLIDSTNTSYITENKGVMENNQKLDEIGIPAQNALSDVDIPKMLKKIDTALSDFMTRGEVFYGMILNSPKGSYIIQSSLYRFISNIFYSGKDNFIINSNGYDRISYILLKAYLSCSNIGIGVTGFIKVFPQFSDIMLKYNTLMNEVHVAFISEAHRKKNVAVPTVDPKNAHSVLFNNTLQSLISQYLKYTKSNTFKLCHPDMSYLFIKSAGKLSTLYDLFNYVDPTPESKRA